MAAICGHPLKLLSGQLEHEIDGETLLIATDLFFETLCRNPIYSSQIGVNHDAAATNEKDHVLSFGGGDCFRWGDHDIVPP